MTIKLNITEVAFRAQGLVESVDLRTFHADALDAMMEYGVRRWFQDHINSKAKDARDNGEEFDPQSTFAARLEQAVTGEITVRNGVPSDPLDQYRIAVIRAFMGADDPDAKKLKAAYDAIPADDQKARRELLLSVARDNAAAVDPKAESLRAIDESKRKATAGISISL